MSYILCMNVGYFVLKKSMDCHKFMLMCNDIDVHYMHMYMVRIPIYVMQLCSLIGCYKDVLRTACLQSISFS